MGIFLMEKSKTTDIQRYHAILSLIDGVGVGLANETHLTDAEKLSEWVEILEWGIKELPEGYEKTVKTREFLLEAIATPHCQDFMPALTQELMLPVTILSAEEREAEIHCRYAAGESKENIACALGIGVEQVDTVLEQMPF